eukprot:6003914-Alexandrium_andersonii.AAC.1
MRARVPWHSLRAHGTACTWLPTWRRAHLRHSEHQLHLVHEGSTLIHAPGCGSVRALLVSQHARTHARTRALSLIHI